MAYSEFFGWSVFQQHDVVRVLNDPATFSNAVSTHLSAPNGMDPPEHAAYRRTIEPYFQPEKMTAFEPQCRQIAASLAQERPALAALWAEFPAMCKPCCKAGTPAQNDIVASLLEEQVNGRKLRDDEIVSLLRNWTVGELSTIAASVGILAHYLAEHPPVQQLLRNDPTLIGAANDEILRIHAPLIANRRVARAPVELGGRTLAAGDRIAVVWASANRDEAVFGDLANQRKDGLDLLREILVVGDSSAPVGQACGFTIVVIDINQVNVAGDIELAPTQLAHADDPQLGAAVAAAWAGALRHTVRGVQRLPGCLHGHIQCQLGQLGHGAGHHT